MTVYEPDREPPSWLGRLLDRATSTPVPPAWRPPAEGARAAAVLILFGPGPGPGHGHGEAGSDLAASDGAGGGARSGGASSSAPGAAGPDSQGPDILLIQRAATLSKHAGQPAFPGGAVDPGDDGPVGAALREAAEETGLDPDGVEVLACLPELYVSPSHFRVTPVVGWWHTPCAVAPNDPGEVAAVARVPVASLADPANRLRVRHPGGTSGPAFRVADMLIWGFTAGLLDRLLASGGLERPWGDGPAEDLPPDVLALARRR